MKILNFLLLFLLFFHLSLKGFNKVYAVNNIMMFSSKIDGQSNELLVVKNDEVFIRKANEEVFEYFIPDDDCFYLKNGAYICIKNGLVSILEGNIDNIANENQIQTNRYGDEFYMEKNTDCNAMKFDIINQLFLKKEDIDGFETQLYLPDYYSLIRLVLYRDLIDDKKTKAFIISDKNDVGCSPFSDYKIYKLPVEEYNVKTLKKKKKIESKTNREFLQKLSAETYKTMLLPKYVYLQPASILKEPDKVILSIENCDVKSINIMAVDFEWKKIGFNEMFTFSNHVDNKKNVKK